MTTIVVDFENKKIFTDSQGTVSNWEVEIGFFTRRRKIRNNCTSFIHAVKARVNIDAGCIIAGVGNASDLEEFMKRYPAGIPNCSGKSTIIVAYPKGDSFQVLQYKPEEKKGLFSKSYEWNETCFLRSKGYLTYGSGQDFARAALECGKTPQEAIVIAAQCDLFTDDKVVEYYLSGAINEH